MIEQAARNSIGDASRKFGSCFTWKYLKNPTSLVRWRTKNSAAVILMMCKNKIMMKMKKTMTTKKMKMKYDDIRLK